jgi:uncharacterized protein YecT (DUF1311 family)
MIWLLLAIADPTLDAEIQACRPTEEEIRPLTLCLAERSFERAGARLNAQWSITFAHVKARDGNKAAGKLRKAQRTWIKKRDQECNAEAAPTPTTQQGRNLMGCLAVRTDKRTEELRQIAETK